MWRVIEMKQANVSLDERIASFMARKEQLFPEILQQQIGTIQTEQRGRRVMREYSSLKVALKHARLA